MDRSASAVWQGSLKEGKGTISTQSGTLKDTQYFPALRRGLRRVRELTQRN